MRIYSAPQIRRVLHCSDRVFEDVVWALDLGRHFVRKYNAQEAEAIMSYYYAHYRRGVRIRDRVDSGADPEGLEIG